MDKQSFFRFVGTFTIVAAFAAGLVACAGGADKPKPAELGANPKLLGVTNVWSAQIGAVDFPLEVRAKKNALALAASDGTVLALEAVSGTQLWRTHVGAAIAAGVGYDGRFAAVVTKGNELVVLEAGKEVWRSQLTARVFTAPLVAGDRVFVLAADRSVAAFDAASGRKLWRIQRPGEALVLQQALVLMPVQNTLIAGFSGRMVAINPLSGAVIWDAAIATPRGTNDIERLVDLVSGVRRNAGVVCTRAFQAAIGCVDTNNGKVLWRRNASGSVGLQGDEQHIFGVEGDGRLVAWRAADGEPAWETDLLRFRQLSAPVVVGRSVAVGDDSGLIHLLSRKDGTPLTRLTTDGSPITVAPVLVDNTLVAVTHKGGVFGFRPE